jgi:hypothetical protein
MRSRNTELARFHLQRALPDRVVQSHDPTQAEHEDDSDNSIDLPGSVELGLPVKQGAKHRPHSPSQELAFEFTRGHEEENRWQAEWNH